MWRTWNDACLEVQRCVCDPSTDTLMLNVIGPKRKDLYLRIDPVRVDDGVEYWMSAIAPTPWFFRTFSRAGALTVPGSSDRAHVDSRSTHDAILQDGAVVYWRGRDDRSIAEHLRRALETELSIPSDRLRLEQLECTPAGLDRRINGEAALIRRLVEHRPRGIAARTCERCGLPLSDPESIAIGIGPECRKYFSANVIASIRRRSMPDPNLARAKRRGEWVNAVQLWSVAMSGRSSG